MILDGDTLVFRNTAIFGASSGTVISDYIDLGPTYAAPSPGNAKYEEVPRVVEKLSEVELFLTVTDPITVTTGSVTVEVEVLLSNASAFEDTRVLCVGSPIIVSSTAPLPIGFTAFGLRKLPIFNERYIGLGFARSTDLATGKVTGGFVLKQQVNA